MFKNYNELFEGFSPMKCPPYDIKLKSNAQPVVRYLRNVPVAIKPLLEVEIERMEKLGVIEKQKRTYCLG